jgi:hypothetical protein
MGFASGFVTGLAKSVDDQLKNDMLRTQKRMDGMEQYRVTRKRADIERKQKEGNELAETLQKLASFTDGNIDYAEQVYLAVGANTADANAYYDVLKKNQEVTKNFKLSDHVKFGEMVRSKDVKAKDVAANYIDGIKETKSENVKGYGLMSLFDRSKSGEQIDKKVNEQVPTTESAFGLVKRNANQLAKIDHSGMIAYKEHQKNNRRKYGTSYVSDLIILEGELSFTKDPDEKEKLTKEIAQRRADVNLEAANALAGKNKETSFFSKPQIGTLIKDTKNGALSGVSSQVQGIDGIISTIIEGKEAEAFQVQRNAFIALKKAYAPAKSDVFNMAIDAQQNAINLEIQNYIKDFTQNRVARKGKKLHDPMTDAEIKAGIKGSSSGTTKTKPLINIGDVVQIKLPNGGVKIAIYTGNDFINDQMPTPVATQ